MNDALLIREVGARLSAVVRTSMGKKCELEKEVVKRDASK